MSIDFAAVDSPHLSKATYLIAQTFRYEYPEPITQLNHRLMVIPPERFGDQRRLRHQLSIPLDGVHFESREDDFGNVVVDVMAPRVSCAIEFVAEVSVERHAGQPNRVGRSIQDRYLLEPTRLTQPDDRIRRAAEEMAASVPWGLDLADRINDWVYQSMTYQLGATGVRTTAACVGRVERPGNRLARRIVNRQHHLNPRVRSALTDKVP
jgi:transglutaminase-like putative cysteine protease